MGSDSPEDRRWKERKRAMTDVKCPDCDVTMERGFVPDQGYGHVTQSKWLSGLATFKRLVWIYFTEPKELLLVTSFRCPQCGLLREYAQPK